jgi:hypothetical protein
MNQSAWTPQIIIPAVPTGPASRAAAFTSILRRKDFVTIALTSAADRNQVLQNLSLIGPNHYLCVREHVVKTTYVCDLPSEPMTRIVRDERNSPERAVFAGLGAVLDPNSKVDRAVGVGMPLSKPEKVRSLGASQLLTTSHIQYYRRACTRDCFPPELQWIRQVKEKYELTSLLKGYGGCTPERDGQQISVKVKSQFR